MPILLTTPLGFPLPHPSNDPYAVDVARLIEAITMIDTFITNLTQASADSVAAVVGNAPASLNTLGELAAAIGGNPNAFSELAGAIQAKPGAQEVATAIQNVVEQLNQLSSSLGGRIDSVEANTSTRARQIARGIAYSGAR